jgi:hypothetical protein
MVSLRLGCDKGLSYPAMPAPQANRRRRFSPQPSRLLPEFGLFERFLERCRHPATSSLSRWKSWCLGFESGSRHLYFYTFLGKILDSTEATTRRALLLTYHDRYHNGHSFLVPREEIVEAYGGLAMPGGGDVSVGVGGLQGRERQEPTV